MDRASTLLLAALIFLPRPAAARGHTVPHPSLGYRFRPNANEVSEKRVHSRLIYRVTYRADALGRRLTPVTGEGRAQFAIFFGDSNVFGEGLHDQDTLPVRFAQAAPQFAPYNYGFSGWGPAHTLLLLQNPKLEKEIPEKQGIGFFGYYAFHKDRVQGDTKVIDWSQGTYPCFELDDNGRAIFQGSFAKRFPYRVWLAKKVEPWVKRFSPGTAFPLRLGSRSREELTCEILTESKTEFEKRFPGSPFVVVLMPNKSAVDPIQETCLAPRGIMSLDLRQSLPKGKEGDYVYPFDGHLNQAGAAFVAKKIAEWTASRDRSLAGRR